jgi:hypothetical protein
LSEISPLSIRQVSRLGKVALLASIALGYVVAILVIVFVFGADIGNPFGPALFPLIASFIGVTASKLLHRRA